MLTFFLLVVQRPPSSTLFPYTTLFRSWRAARAMATTCAASSTRASSTSIRRRCTACCAGSNATDGCGRTGRSEEHTSELQSRRDLVCRLLLEKTKYDHPTYFLMWRGC